MADEFMYMFLKRSLSTVVGAISYSLLSLWLNLIQYGFLSIAIIGSFTKEFFLLPFNALSSSRYVLGVCIGLIDSVIGIAFGAAAVTVAFPFVVAMTIYDFVHNGFKGAYDGYTNGLRPIFKTIADHWEPFKVIDDSQSSDYKFTLFESLYSLMQKPKPNDEEPLATDLDLNIDYDADNGYEPDPGAEVPVFEMPNEDDFESREDYSYQILYTIMGNFPKAFFCTVYNNLKKDNPSISVHDAIKQAHQTALYFYVQAFAQRQYYLIDIYIETYPAQREQALAALFEKCITEHLLDNEEPLRQYLEQHPEQRQIAENRINIQEQKQNAFIKLKRIEPYKDLRLNEKDYESAKKNESVQMQELLKKYDSLVENLSSEVDELMQMDFESDNHIILFVKQYLDHNNTWQSIPALTYVSCQENAEKWFKRNSIHPISKDNVVEPAKFKERPTRYVWHPYKDGDGCQQLNQLSDKIRTVLRKSLNPDNQPAPHDLKEEMGFKPSYV